MESAVEKAMKVANVEYEVKSDKTEIANEATVTKTAVEELERDKRAKLKPFSYDKFKEECAEDIAPYVQQAREALDDLVSTIAEGNAIGVFVQSKLITDALKKAEEEAIPFANSQFVEDAYKGDATIKKYTPRRKWQYSKDLTEKIAIIAARQKEEEKSGTAIDVSPPVDVIKSKIFAVSLKK